MAAPVDRLRVLLAVAAAAAAVLLAWLMFFDDGEESSAAAENAEIASVPELSELSDSLGHPVYWAGERPGVRYELTQTEDGRVYVRYLTGDAEVGDSRPEFLTVGTYPVPDALEALRRAAGRSDSPISEAAGGAELYVDEDRPSSVYLAHPESDFQIEVFHPDPESARNIAGSGEIEPVP